MIRVYEAANVTDAHLVKSLLEDAGIPALIRGEYLQGVLGEVPVSGQIDVSVADADAGRARAIVEDWQAASPDPAFAGGEDTDAEHAPPAPRNSPGRRHVVGLVVALLAVVVACWAILRPLA